MKCPRCQAENEASASACAACGARFEAGTAPLASDDLSPGTVLDDRYELRESLGSGGMGIVYKAHDRMLDETVAIKVLRPDTAREPHMAERFRSEIKLARKIRHRNVCAIHDYGEDRGLLYISMEFIEGVDLKRVLHQRGALPEAQAYEVAIQVAEGLQAVHEAGIIHRDLKTPNIMLDAQGVARLMDFGIAKRHGVEGGTLTATGQIIGTPEYMSPEQAQGLKVDFRSDLYALGAVIYEIFSGRVPFRGDTPIATILKHLHEPPPLDDPSAAGIPHSLRPLLRRALAKEPAQRPGSARELIRELQRARGPDRSEPATTALTVTHTTMQSATRRPRPGLHPHFRIGLAALAAAVVIVAGAMWLRPKNRNEPLVPAPAAPAAAPLASPESSAPPSTTPPVGSATARPSRRISPAPGVPASPTPLRRSLPNRTAEPTPAASVAPSISSQLLPSAPLPPGQLLVAVRPWGEVSIDGNVVGTTPLDRLSLPPGAHHVHVRHPGYPPWEGQVTILSGQLERLIVDLPAQATKP